MARSIARHVTFVQAHATRHSIHGRVGLEAFPTFDDDIEVNEDQWGPNLLNDPLVI